MRPGRSHAGLLSLNFGLQSSLLQRLSFQFRSLAALVVDQVSYKAQAWELAGDIFDLLKDTHEARKACLTSIETEDNVPARQGLACVLAARIETRPEAEEVLRAIIAAPRKAVCGQAANWPNCSCTMVTRRRRRRWSQTRSPPIEKWENRSEWPRFGLRDFGTRITSVRSSPL